MFDFRPLFSLVLSVAGSSCGGTVIDGGVSEGDSEATGGSSGTSGGFDPGGTGAATNPEGCPPPPECTWCQGEARRDSRGCVVGFTCANGADACSTSPCDAPEECGSGRICLPDRLCWTGPTACLSKTCDGSSQGSCACHWQCNDDRVYRSECGVVADGSVMCKCRVDGEAYPWVCVVEEGGEDACGLGATCCGFPH